MKVKVGGEKENVVWNAATEEVKVNGEKENFKKNICYGKHTSFIFIEKRIFDLH